LNGRRSCTIIDFDKHSSIFVSKELLKSLPSFAVNINCTHKIPSIFPELIDDFGPKFLTNYLRTFLQSAQMDIQIFESDQSKADEPKKLLRSYRSEPNVSDLCAINSKPASTNKTMKFTPANVQIVGGIKNDKSQGIFHLNENFTKKLVVCINIPGISASKCSMSKVLLTKISRVQYKDSLNDSVDLNYINYAKRDFLIQNQSFLDALNNSNFQTPHSKLFEKINEKCDYFQNKDLIMNLFHSNESVNFIYTKPQILGDSKDDSSNFVLGPDIPQSAMQLKIDKFVQKDQKIIFTAHLDMRGLKTFYDSTIENCYETDMFISLEIKSDGCTIPLTFSKKIHFFLFSSNFFQKLNTRLHMGPDEYIANHLTNNYSALWHIPSLDLNNLCVKILMCDLNNMLEQDLNSKSEEISLNKKLNQILSKIKSYNRAHYLKMVFPLQKKFKNIYTLSNPNLRNQSQVHEAIMENLSAKPTGLQDAESKWWDSMDGVGSKLMSSIVSPIKDFFNENSIITASNSEKLHLTSQQHNNSFSNQKLGSESRVEESNNKSFEASHLSERSVCAVEKNMSIGSNPATNVPQSETLQTEKKLKREKFSILIEGFEVVDQNAEHSLGADEINHEQEKADREQYEAENHLEFILNAHKEFLTVQNEKMRHQMDENCQQEFNQNLLKQIESKIADLSTKNKQPSENFEETIEIGRPSVILNPDLQPCASPNFEDDFMIYENSIR